MWQTETGLGHYIKYYGNTVTYVLFVYRINFQSIFPSSASFILRMSWNNNECSYMKIRCSIFYSGVKWYYVMLIGGMWHASTLCLTHLQPLIRPLSSSSYQQHCFLSWRSPTMHCSSIRSLHRLRCDRGENEWVDFTPMSWTEFLNTPKLHLLSRTTLFSSSLWKPTEDTIRLFLFCLSLTMQ